MLDVRRYKKLQIVEKLKTERGLLELEVVICKSPALSFDEVWWELRHKPKINPSFFCLIVLSDALPLSCIVYYSCIQNMSIIRILNLETKSTKERVMLFLFLARVCTVTGCCLACLSLILKYICIILYLNSLYKELKG
ncbi:hypothetical protein V8G54_017051 [Vigna mungo]|uniref:Uncharacterized protein n=1 Tax=Vigna mungo TaxID=3915 RepID=A0AAQ3NMA9_VIGMU